MFWIMVCIASIACILEAGLAQKPGYDSLYKHHAKLVGLDWKLLKAIAITESSENPKAVNPSDPSYGLMQLLCTKSTVRTCGNFLYLQDWPPATKEQLFDPDYSLHIASQILSMNVKSYGLWKGVAVYNCWGARNDARTGPFRNQKYVDKVKKEYDTLVNS